MAKQSEPDSGARKYCLTIRYIGPNNKEVAPKRCKSCVEGLLYSVKSPTITGMVADRPMVAVNLHEDREIKVRYRSIDEA